MGRKYKRRILFAMIAMVIIFVAIAGISINYGSEYIQQQLLQSDQSKAVDTAMLISNSFKISDAEVEYMKSLTFSEMERDPINKRLMDYADGVDYKNKISNIYVMIILDDDEVKYTADEEMADLLGTKVGAKLNGMWLLNGKFDEEGKFEEATREDKFRYLEFCKGDAKIFDSRESFGLVSKDAWGKFITGYTPVYSEEGTYIGILGVDLDLDHYHDKVSIVTNNLIKSFSVTLLAMIIILLIFYSKYMKSKEGQLYFEFYSRMSHDMRTPMNGILGIASLSKAENDVDILKHNYQLIEESGNYMLGLINDTLDVQKLGTGRMHLEPKVRNMSKMYESIISIINSNANQKNIIVSTEMISMEENKYCYVDELRLRQVILNIVSNAIKFTPAYGKISISLENSGKEGGIDHTKLTVTDSGIGMSKQFIEHKLFKPYSQEQNSVTTQYGGTGLGLSIVKQLVDLMGGKITVESELGKGTTFTVYIDFKEATKEDVEQYLLEEKKNKEDMAGHLEGKRVLLCEDNELNVMVLKAVLEKFGMKVDVATNGEEAVRDYEKEKPNYYDVILMDVRMPVMDGLEATRRIRATKREDSKSIPIIAVTANTYDEDKTNCKKAGMNDHISKPIQVANVYEVIVKHVHK